MLFTIWLFRVNYVLIIFKNSTKTLQLLQREGLTNKHTRKLSHLGTDEFISKYWYVWFAYFHGTFILTATL